MYERGTYKDETEKKSWRSIMKAEYFSSEESGLDDDEEVIFIHPLTWLSPIVQQFKNKLDLEIKNHKTPLARRQMKKRVTGMHSNRPKPTNTTDIPDWVFI